MIDRPLSAKQQLRIHKNIIYRVYCQFKEKREQWRIYGWRLKDRANLLFRPGLKPLHMRFRVLLDEQKQCWPKSYSEGYFYQGWRCLGITGSRPTEDRARNYGFLKHLTNEMWVLDVGANVGFLSLTAAPSVHEVHALELNPYLVAMGREAAMHLGISNTQFIEADFLSFVPQRAYDAVFAFASHWTDDGNLRIPFSVYFRKIAQLLNVGGLVFFESHAADVGNASFTRDMEDVLLNFEKIDSKLIRNPVWRGGTRWFYLLRKRG